MSSTIFIREGLEIPEAEIQITTSRSGGPGGQHVNKTSTKVTLRWSIAQSQALSEDTRIWLMKRLASRLTLEGELVLQVDTSRSQIQNREIAYERFVHTIQHALLKPKKRIPTKPKKSAQLRRLQTKKRVSNIKTQRKISRHESD